MGDEETCPRERGGSDGFTPFFPAFMLQRIYAFTLNFLWEVEAGEFAGEFAGFVVVALAASAGSSVVARVPGSAVVADARLAVGAVDLTTDAYWWSLSGRWFFRLFGGRGEGKMTIRGFRPRLAGV
jgi:hypothetical protein